MVNMLSAVNKRKKRLKQSMSSNLLFCLAILGAGVLSTKADSYLDNGWFPLENGQSYKVVWEKLNYHAARARCQGWGGDLAVQGMKDFGERMAICNIMLDDRSSFWIGLIDQESEGKWVWIDGNYAYGAQAIWRPNEPNDTGAGEDCATIDHQFSFKANDVPCGVAKFALCEKTT